MYSLMKMRGEYTCITPTNRKIQNNIISPKNSLVVLPN